MYKGNLWEKVPQCRNYIENHVFLFCLVFFVFQFKCNFPPQARRSAEWHLPDCDYFVWLLGSRGEIRFSAWPNRTVIVAVAELGMRGDASIILLFGFFPPFGSRMNSISSIIQVYIIHSTFLMVNGWKLLLIRCFVKYFPPYWLLPVATSLAKIPSR